MLMIQRKIFTSHYKYYAPDLLVTDIRVQYKFTLHYIIIKHTVQYKKRVKITKK